MPLLSFQRGLVKVYYEDGTQTPPLPVEAIPEAAAVVTTARRRNSVAWAEAHGARVPKRQGKVTA